MRRLPLASKMAALLHRPAPRVVELPDAEIDIPPYLVDFLARVGVSLCAASETTDRTETELHELAVAYDLHDARFFVLPTGVFTRLAKGPTTDVDFASVQNRALRLDQTSDVYALIDKTKKETPPPREALADLDRILIQPSRFNELSRIIGRAVVGAGIGMVLGLSWQGLIAGAAMATLIGLLNLFVERNDRLSMAFPVVSAALVTVLVGLVVGPWAADEPLRLIIPPLVAFLPGTALTIGSIELAAGEIVAGSTRLVSGINSLVLLAFGVFVGAVLIDSTTWESGVSTNPPVWFAALGVLVFGVGQFVFSSAPRKSFLWIMLALYLTWGGQVIASHLVSGSASGVVGAFVGGLIVVPTAIIIARRGGPPAQVTYLPAFWILVPGAVGFTGVTELLGAAEGVGISDIVTTFLTIIAIAMGVLVASSFSRAASEQSRPVW